MLDARKGDANIGGASVALPRSVFIEQSHIKTICTRVQFALNHCPKGSIYGYAKAFTPLLDQPLKGPVYLRSSNNLLPDLVVDLQGGGLRVIQVGFVDSVPVKGTELARLRTRFLSVPDAPVSKIAISLFGGKKGLIVNSRNLCKTKNRAKVSMVGQNGRRYDTRPVVKAECGKKKKRKSNKRR